MTSTFSSYTQASIENAKQNINLASRVLVGTVEDRNSNLMEIGTGYLLEPDQEIEVNREQLLRDFNLILRDQYPDEEEYMKVKGQIPVKILVMHDRFYAAGINDQWSEAYYFQYTKGNHVYFLNIRNNQAYYLVNGTPYYEIIDQEIRDQVVIGRVNEVVSAYTNAYLTDTGNRYTNNQLKIEIQNPSEIDLQKLNGMNDEEISNFFAERYRQANFNILDGITFFTVYLEEEYLAARGQEIVYKNYNVAGYTLDANRKIRENN